mmetsp:Transcript_9917/g.23863  ORF Transcript_9917/g.23863 Transcript_9917/m.23863 type:complete len:336 (-) Transcript_9917:459-1466(-)
MRGKCDRDNEVSSLFVSTWLRSGLLCSDCETQGAARQLSSRRGSLASRRSESPDAGRADRPRARARAAPACARRRRLDCLPRSPRRTRVGRGRDADVAHQGWRQLVHYDLQVARGAGDRALAQGRPRNDPPLGRLRLYCPPLLVACAPRHPFAAARHLYAAWHLSAAQPCAGRAAASRLRRRRRRRHDDDNDYAEGDSGDDGAWWQLPERAKSRGPRSADGRRPRRLSATLGEADGRRGKRLSGATDLSPGGRHRVRSLNPERSAVLGGSARLPLDLSADRPRPRPRPSQARHRRGGPRASPWVRAGHFRARSRPRRTGRAAAYATARTGLMPPA